MTRLPRVGEHVSCPTLRGQVTRLDHKHSGSVIVWVLPDGRPREAKYETCFIGRFADGGLNTYLQIEGEVLT